MEYAAITSNYLLLCHTFMDIEANYRTGSLLGSCATTCTGRKYALIREMRLIKSAFFNAGILRNATKCAFNSEYAPNNVSVRYDNSTFVTSIPRTLSLSSCSL